MIRFWLHTEPAQDLDKWREQTRQAVWIEKRFYAGMANAIWGKSKG